MRHLSHNRRSQRREAHARRGLVLFVAFMLLVTGLPFALAGDDVAVDETQSDATAAEATVQATEDPIVIPVDPPSKPVDTEAPADPVDPVDEPAEEPADGGDEPAALADPVQEPSVNAHGDSTDGDAETTQTRKQAPAAANLEATATSAPDGGDFSIDWAASEPFSYSHLTGGGVYASGGNDTTVESLNGGDFLCGDIVSYLAAITVDDSNATDASTLQFTTSFATLTSSESGIGHEEIVRAVINTGDPGMDGDATLVSLDRSTSGGDLIGVVTVADLEAGEQIIVRIDVRLGCQTGGKNVGTIHASLGNIRVIAPTQETVPGGAQTIPFKQSGVARDLIVTKDVVGNAPPNTTYTVTVACLKGNTATLTFTGDGSKSAGLIPEGDTCTVTETDDGGADRTTVRVNGGATTNSHTTSIVIGASNEVTFTNTFLAADVEVGKSASPTTVAPDGTITYTITARNTATSPVAARDVVVTDDLDDDLENVSASVSVAGGASRTCGDPGAGNTISCAVGDLAIGQSAVVTVTARATIASCGEVLNRASAAGSNFTTVNSPQVTVTVLCAPDLNIVKSSSDDEVVPGEDFTYTITATNRSTATAAATGVTITDDLDDSLTGVTATFVKAGGAAQTCTIGADNAVSCDVRNLGIGESATVTISVTPTPASCPSITNRASVSGTNFPTEQSDAVDVTVTCTAGLTISKTASDTSVVAGESWSYEITVANPASSTATTEDVVVIDDLHDGLDVAQPTFSVEGGPAQDCGLVALFNIIRCDVLDLAPGESAVITVVATATPASCGPIVNLAQASASNITDPVSDTVTVDVVCAPAIVVDKTASAATVAAGDDITYTITASNPTGSATATAEDVVVTDTLDDMLFGIDATITKDGVTTDCILRSDNFVSCDAGDIPVGGTAVVTITATTTEATCGVVTNVSSADGTNFTTVTSPTVDVTVLCPPVIAVAKTASTGLVDIGEDYTYTITTTNNALPTGSPAQDVVITDDLDDDLAAVSATYQVGAGPAQPCDATGPGNTVRCAIGDLPIGASADVTIDATATLEACGSVRNISTASGTNFTSVTSDEVNVLIPCPGPPPSISLVKTGVAPDDGPGDLITYTYLITNTGGTTLTDITLDDDVLGSITVPKTTLLAGESMTATATHEITLTDIERGEVVNVAETTGTTPTGGTVRDEDTETIPLEADPSILLEKVADREFAEVGETVTYTYVITNTGDTRLTDITLVDDKIGIIVSVDDGLSLAPGESTSVEADYTLTEADLAAGKEVTNVAVTSGLPPKGPPVTSTDRVTVGITEILAGGLLRVVKEVGGDGSPAPGAEFGFAVDCGETGLGRRGSFTLDEDGGTYDVGVPIEGGTTCTVTETRDAGADATTVAVDSGAAQTGTSTTVTIVDDETTTVTFVNTFGRLLPPPEPPPEDPDLPATGANLALQLALGMGLLMMGTGMVRLFGPTTGRGRRHAGPTTWTTTL